MQVILHLLPHADVLGADHVEREDQKEDRQAGPAYSCLGLCESGGHTKVREGRSPTSLCGCIPACEPPPIRGILTGSMGYGNTYGLSRDTGLVGRDYSLAVTMNNVRSPRSTPHATTTNN